MKHESSPPPLVPSRKTRAPAHPTFSEPARRELLDRIEAGYRDISEGKADRALDRLLAAAETAPGIAAVWHALGLACESTGRAGDATEFLKKATELAGEAAIYWRDLSRVLLANNENEAAIAACGKAIGIDRSDAIAHYLRGQACANLKRYTEAIDAFGAVLTIEPNSAPALSSLGNVMRAINRLSDSMDLYRMALRADPAHTESWHNLAVIHTLRNEWKEAAACEAEAVSRRPGFWQGFLGLGLALSQQKLYEEAEPCLERALAIAGEQPDILIELGNLAAARREASEALAFYRRAIEADPTYVGAYLNAANLLRINGELAEALSLSMRVREMDPTHIGAHTLIGNCLTELGRVREAMGSFQTAVEINPHDRVAHSSLLYNLNFHSAFARRQTAALHAAWGRIEETRTQTTRIAPKSRMDPKKRLRIGYVSGDFRRHSVMYFMEPILRRHDRKQIEVFCYSNVDREDPVTHQVRRMDVVWRDISSLPDEVCCQRIVDDEIDILVDLSGHTGGNRLGIFSRKPAPLQCTYLGYPNTTGLRNVDYRIVDSITDPEGADPFHTESLVRLPHGFLCFSEPDLTGDAVAVDSRPFDLRIDPILPEHRRGFLSFGTFNNNKKIDIECTRVWGKLLAAFPESRMLLKGRAYRNREARDTVYKLFAESGIAQERVHLRFPQAALAEHLSQYNDIDIALDTYPYNGTTTTFEALWMGVPVVTLSGEQHSSRVGASILTRLGHPEWLATNEAEFVAAGAALAADQDLRLTLRQQLRERLRRSPLMDEDLFVSQLEGFYRSAWRALCEKQSVHL